MSEGPSGDRLEDYDAERYRQNAMQRMVDMVPLGNPLHDMMEYLYFSAAGGFTKSGEPNLLHNIRNVEGQDFPNVGGSRTSNPYGGNIDAPEQLGMVYGPWPFGTPQYTRSGQVIPQSPPSWLQALNMGGGAIG